jgi:uncharacterized repeat protein (TIGR01451 family)
MPDDGMNTPRPPPFPPAEIMTLRTSCLLLALFPAIASAQAPWMPPPHPGVSGRIPLLYVRFLGPQGLRMTFYQGQPRGRAFDLPVAVGLRPSYLYRVEVSHLPTRPGVSFFPTLEVHCGLDLPPKYAASKFPVPVVFTEADIEAVLAGIMVTKVVYLEAPDRATPEASLPDRPLETDLPPQANLAAEVRERGRAVLVVRMGGRLLISPEDLAHESVYGTMLLPGDHVLPPAARPPCLPCDLHRPDDICIHDGGDCGPRAGLDPAGNLHGLDPEDTVAEYTDSHGRRSIACSNRVCLCVPRFAVLRQLSPPGLFDTAVGPDRTRLVVGREELSLRQPPQQTTLFEQPRGLNVRLKPWVNVGVENPGRIERLEVLEAREVIMGPIIYLGTKYVQQLTEVQRAQLVKQLEFTRTLSSNVVPHAMIGVEGTAVVGRVEGLKIITAEATTHDLTICCPEGLVLPPDKPLVLIKCADRSSAQPGDVVTFFLRYSNHGGKPITDVAVSDSLSPRLEYVPESAQSDRPAVFTTQTNEAGSLILRWEITGTLQPGQSGSLRFQARVR